MKRYFIHGKIIIGIDPSKKKHQAIVMNAMGDPISNSFSFQNSYSGFHHTLWQKLKQVA